MSFKDMDRIVLDSAMEMGISFEDNIDINEGEYRRLSWDTFLEFVTIDRLKTGKKRFNTEFLTRVKVIIDALGYDVEGTEVLVPTEMGTYFILFGNEYAVGFAPYGEPMDLE